MYKIAVKVSDNQKTIIAENCDLNSAVGICATLFDRSSSIELFIIDSKTSMTKVIWSK